MKKQIKIWALRLTATVLFTAMLLIVIVLNPILTYASKTTHKKYTIFYNKALDQQLLFRLNEAGTLLQKSEFYNPMLKFDICLDDGSIYPAMMQKIRGKAFAWGFYNKVVLQGNADYENNYVELNGYKWNLTQLLAHELTHCLQFSKLGFWKSNPVAGIPGWKWEGYPEYVARQGVDQKDLSKIIERLLQTERINNNGWIKILENTGTVIPYYKSWLLIQYCIDIKEMSYQQILNDPTKEETVWRKMMTWYNNQKRL